jgi:riboflavin kinase/FMN adenylyltransferase
MRHLRRLVPGNGPGYVATIGGFDGLHRGHRVLIDRSMSLARDAGLASMVISFEPLPREFFFPADPPARLTSFRERWRALERGGPDVFCTLRFCTALRNLSAVEFARMLVAAGVQQLVIGHDFKAGRGGEADAAWFASEGPRLGLVTTVVAPVLIDGQRVGSRLVREALASGDFARAECLLGRRYSITGRVIQGEQLGRKLGYPTANMRLARRRAPMNGIFAVRVRGAAGKGLDGEPLAGVASLGTRPTVGGTVPLLETHIFDFSGDLYGREIEVEFVARLRDELRFDSVAAMVEQIHRDAAAARDVLLRSVVN